MHTDIITLKGMRVIRARIMAERVREMAHKGLELTFALFVVGLALLTLIQFIQSPMTGDWNLPPLPTHQSCPLDN